MHTNILSYKWSQFHVLLPRLFRRPIPPSIPLYTAADRGEKGGNSPFPPCLFSDNTFSLHPAVIRPACAFGANPSNVLRRVFDVARFAVHAVGGVDLQARTAVFFNDFVHTGRTIARFGWGVFFVVHVYHRLRIVQHQMVGLIFFVREIGEEDAA